MRLTILIGVMLLHVLSGQGQEHFLERLNVSTNDQKVSLSWTISSGNTCDGTTIMRSIDSINFIPIGEISGTCGSVIDPVTYRFVDHHPFKNRTNFYRLEFGNVGISDVLSVFVVEYGETGYLLQPNPLKDHATIYFRNPHALPTTFTVFSMKGDKIFEKVSNGASIAFKLPDLPSAVYLFTLTRPGDSNPIQGKMVVEK